MVARGGNLRTVTGICFSRNRIPVYFLSGRCVSRKNILVTIDKLLAEAGTDKSKAMSATIWLSNMDDFAAMNEVWDAWVSPGNTPTRACVESKLAAPQFIVEIAITAAIV